MTEKLVYQTNHLGILVGAVKADESPLEPGVYMIPGGCVEIAPPPTPEHKAAWWNGKAWQLVDYFGGVVVYDTATGEPRTLEGFEPVPAGHTMNKPGPNQIWKNGGWVDDIDAVLAALRDKKLQMIGADCAEYVAGGFNSSALGDVHRYSSAIDDQVNLNAQVLLGLDDVYPCTGVDQVLAFRPHTIAQLQKVSHDLVRFRQAAQQQAEALRQAVAGALKDKDLKAMKAITWTPPA
ncbi:hypothetical protein LOY52_09065 [Pseudomonas sp. B21-051]|uniref:DUF4376 domain-containing protein n=1 Tax=Pseudomonas sp. B21-051 TaxID=2895491 RepID=UPI00215E76D6|nr:hypothetical protein [Pseudomonas sp. B21-051]UVK90202.1 hypothetical protein LOY52_09065 [Pseudomonas sp. B21-051]